MTARPTWLPDAAVGLIVLTFGLWEVLDRNGFMYGAGSDVLADGFTPLLLVVTMAVAAGLHRLSPGFALALVWLAGAVLVMGGAEVRYVMFAGVIVAYGTARWGSPAVLWLSGLSIPLGAVLAGYYVYANGVSFASDFLSDLMRATSGGGGFDITRGVLGFIGFLVLALPWLSGIVFRVRAQARRAREHELEAVASKEQAEQIATVRAEQTRMAHDVHDVVGHSLAVILAQAESAQFLPDEDPARLKETMANIAVSARQSLRDVRQVLSATEVAPQQDGGLDRLVDGVRAAGNDVQSTVVGTPRPLPPDIDAVAYRTLQEMLTNAIKHGVRGQQVTVLRHWAEDLTLAVQNAATGETGPDGLGLPGMRMRLESVGGRLDVRHEEGSYTATAKIPLRHGMLTE